MAVQPDGRIVVAGAAPPGFGMLARLEPDGRLDPSFGEGGIAIDREALPFVDLAIQPDGKIVALESAVRLRRYEADGSPDLSFGSGGGPVPRFSSLDGPVGLVLLPDGRIAFGGNLHVKTLTREALAYVVSPDGRSVEEVGKVAPSGMLYALESRGDGSLLMAGYSSDSFTSSGGEKSILARFVPGAGTSYDLAFGGGSGLAAVPYPGAFPQMNALAPESGAILAAGTVADHMVLSRFSGDGVFDGSFGSDGFVDVAPPPGASQANDVATQPEGKILVAGEVSSQAPDSRSYCSDCRNPLLLRFLADGGLDPSFGEGGIARVVQSDGGSLMARGETVAPLAGGRALIAGRSTRGNFVARIGEDGRPDPSFGRGGIATVEPCPNTVTAQRRRRCLPSIVARLRIRRAPHGHAALHLVVRPNVKWARINSVDFTLPPQLQTIHSRRRQIRATLVRESRPPRSVRIEVHSRRLSAIRIEGPKAVSIHVPASALRVVKPPRKGREVPFRVEVGFGTWFFGYTAGEDDAVLRRAIW